MDVMSTQSGMLNSSCRSPIVVLAPARARRQLSSCPDRPDYTTQMIEMNEDFPSHAFAFRELAEWQARVHPAALIYAQPALRLFLPDAINHTHTIWLEFQHNPAEDVPFRRFTLASAEVVLKSRALELLPFLNDKGKKMLDHQSLRQRSSGMAQVAIIIHGQLYTREAAPDRKSVV